jgi:hypothetical protein
VRGSRGAPSSRHGCNSAVRRYSRRGHRARGSRARGNIVLSTRVADVA